jgi:hypothetical protein
MKLSYELDALLSIYRSWNGSLSQPTQFVKLEIPALLDSSVEITLSIKKLFFIKD